MRLCCACVTVYCACMCVCVCVCVCHGVCVDLHMCANTEYVCAKVRACMLLHRHTGLLRKRDGEKERRREGERERERERKREREREREREIEETEGLGTSCPTHTSTHACLPRNPKHGCSDRFLLLREQSSVYHGKTLHHFERVQVSGRWVMEMAPAVINLTQKPQTKVNPTARFPLRRPLRSQ